MSLGKRIKTAREALRPRMTQAALGAYFDITGQAVSNWERDEDAPDHEKFSKLAQVLRVSTAYLHGEIETPAVAPPQFRISKQMSNNDQHPIDDTTRLGTMPELLRQRVPIETIRGAADLPVYAMVQGGGGVPILEIEPYALIARPRRLEGNLQAYAVQVRGNSMAPEYRENDIAFVDPKLNPRVDDACVFQGKNDDGEWCAIIKYLDRSLEASETHYFVRDGAAPPNRAKLKKSDYERVHVAVGKESGR